MLSKIISASVQGVEAEPVIVETDLLRGLPAFHLVGQADSSVKEARERIRSALVNSGMDYPHSRITVNMSPAYIRKKGSHFDLPIAMGILVSSGQVFDDKMDDCGFFGELSLDGSLNKTDGILPMVLAMRKAGVRNVIVPKANREEASLVHGIRIYPAENLEEIIENFNLQVRIHEISGPECLSGTGKRGNAMDFADVKGQETAKRAITVAVAGGHGILMTGSPSSGKTMLSERIPTIMPDMTYDEIVETTVIYSVAGLLDENEPYICERPFRRPHHKITPAALLGGGYPPSPGEISLADKGVLFLDELGEFDRNLIDALRLPLEKKSITLNRRGLCCVFPADFLLVAATNPCKCGYYGDPDRTCRCSAADIARYRSRLSGPILDRIDLQIRLTPVNYQELTDSRPALSSAEMRKSIESARAIQRKRYHGYGITLNGQLDDHLCEIFCGLGKEEEKLAEEAYRRLELNPRTLLKVKKIARTLADLTGSEKIQANHLAEALQYREVRR